MLAKSWSKRNSLSQEMSVLIAWQQQPTSQHNNSDGGKGAIFSKGKRKPVLKLGC